MIVRTDGNANSAHATPTYTLEVFLHISRAFFRVEYGVAGLTIHVIIADYCTRGASLDALVAPSATVDDRLVGHAERIVGEHRGKSNLATPLRRN